MEIFIFLNIQCIVLLFGNSRIEKKYYKKQGKIKIPEENAVEELIQLIKDCGDWVEQFLSFEFRVPSLNSTQNSKL